MTKRKAKDEIIPISNNIEVKAELREAESAASVEAGLAKSARAKGKKRRHKEAAAKFSRRAANLRGFLKITAGLSFASIPQVPA